MNGTMRLKREKGTTRELVSYLGVMSVVAATSQDEKVARRAARRLTEVVEGRYEVPTGTGDDLRTGAKLAQVVAARTIERGVEGGGMLRVEGVGVWGAN